MRRREPRRALGAVGAACAAVLALAHAARAAEPLSLQAAIRHALESSAEVRAAHEEVAAEEARLAPRDRLLRDNLELRVEAGDRRRAAEHSTDYGVSIEQRIEVGGQRGARAAAARASLEAARARLAEQRVAVATEVRIAFGHVLATGALVRLAEDARALAEKTLAAAEERHRAGDASLIEVNAAKVEAGRASREAVQAAEARATAMLALASLCGIPSAASPGVAGSLEAALDPRDADLEGLVRRALETRPKLVEARHAVAAARAEEALAERDAVPSPRLGLGYEREEEADIVRGSLALELPVFDRNDETRIEATRQLRLAQAELDALERAVRLEVELAVQRVRGAAAAVAAFGADALSALDQNASLVQEGYEAGRIGLVESSLLRRDLIAARREHIESLEALDRARAQLDRVVGALPAGGARASPPGP